MTSNSTNNAAISRGEASKDQRVTNKKQAVLIKRQSDERTNKHEVQARAIVEQWRIYGLNNINSTKLNQNEPSMLSSRDYERNKAQITPARMANFSIANSLGVALSQKVRAPFEDFFQADFSNVRIHSDQAANDFSKDINAKAFTAGNHIYFSHGAFQPETLAGKDLLAHELTHTLQQAGRRTHDTQQKVVSVNFQNNNPNAVIDLQRDALFDQMVEAYRAEADNNNALNDTETSRERRLSAFNDVEQIIRNIIGLRAELNTTVGANAAAVQLEQAILGASDEESRRLAEQIDLQPLVVKAFLYDCLRLLGRFEGAAKIIDDEPMLISWLTYVRFESQFSQLVGFRAFLLTDDDYGKQWAFDIIEDVYGDDFPYNLYQSLWEYLVRPEVSAERAADLSDHYQDYERQASTGFAGNDRVHIAHQLVRDLDETLYQLQLNTDLNSQSENNTDKKYSVSYGFRRFGEQMQNGELVFEQNGEQVQVDTAHFRSIGRGIKSLSDSAIEYWQLVSNIIDASQAAQPINPEWQPSNDDTFESFVSKVVELASAVLISPLENEVLPEPQAYSDAMFELTSQLAPFSEQLSHRLQWNIFRYEHRNNERKRQSAAWLGWGIRWIEVLQGLILRYVQSDDEAFVAVYQRADVRLMHRIIMARYFGLFAQLTQQNELSDLCNDVLSGRDIQDSYLAITGDFNEDSTPIAQLTEDYGGLIHGLGLTAAQLVNLYGVLHLESFNRRLSTLLIGTEAEPEQGRLRLMDDAVETARREVPKPKRYSVPSTDYCIVYYRETEDSLPNRSLEEMLLSHPIYQEFSQPIIAAGGGVIRPRGFPNELYVWKLPSFAFISASLRRFTDLNDLVIVLADLPESVSNLIWMENYIALIEDGIDNEGGQSESQLALRERLLGLVTGNIDRLRETANSDRAYLLTRATIRRRRALAIDLNQQIHEYNEDRSIGNYTVPNDILGEITDFTRLGWSEDMAAHEAALILSLAEKLKELFIQDTWLGDIQERRYDLVTGYYGYVERAITLAEDEPERIRAVTFAASNLRDSDAAVHNRNRVSYESADDLLSNISHLNTLKSSLDTVITSVQTRFGFESDREEIRSLNFHHSLAIGEVMEIMGHTYRITRVYRSFRFHPPYGVGTDAISPAIVNDLRGRPIRANATILKFTIDTGEEITVRNRESDMHYLVLLDEIIATAAFVGSLNNLEEILEQALETGLDLAELIPGIGQGVMVARLLFAIGQFVIRDLPDIQEKLINNPQQMIDQVTELIGNELEAAAPRFLEYMLFGDLPFESQLVAPDVDDDSGSSGGNSSRRKLKRLFEFVTEMCEDALRAFVRLRGRIRGSFVQAQGRIVSSRMLLMLIDAVPILLRLAELGRDTFIASEALDLTDPERLQSRAKEEIESIVNSMVKLEIPNEIIPMSVAIEVILGFAIGKFGRKGKIVKEILEVTGALGEASELIADGLSSQGIDPNILWRDQVRVKLQPLLEHVQATLYTQVQELIETATNGAIVLDEPELRETEINFDEFDEDSLSMDAKARSSQPAQTRPEGVNTSSGYPLPEDLLSQFSSEYGHNFEHVRMHRDTQAAELTHEADAHALTWGSHIFLNRSLNPQTTQGRQILRHELAHVLQQTGPRHREYDHSVWPISGSKGQGVRYDSAKERAADSMAQRAENSDWEESISIEGSGGGFFMPSMRSMATRILENLTDGDVAENQATAFEENVPRSIARKATFLDAVSDARRIWTDTKSHLANATLSNYLAPFDQNQSRIQGYLANTFHSTVNDTIPGIVLRSIQTQANDRVRLLPRLFANNLETYLFARTGYVVNIDIDSGRAGRITMRYLHLANLDARSGPFQDMKANTITWVQANQPDRLSLFQSASAWSQIKLYIDERLQDAQVWHSSEFRLSDRFILDTITMLYNIGEVEVDSWSEYKNPDNVGSSKAGIRVGTHEELTGSRMPRGARTGRQSHHVPQYLLVEYFRNNNQSTLLFDDVNEKLPGFIDTTTHRNLPGYSTSGSTRTIDLEKLDPNGNRGDKLPAVSLAAITHQKGRLHMNASSSWGETDDLESPASQSEKIDQEFIRNLNQQQITGNKAEIASYARGLTGSSLTDFKRKVVVAMKGTYASMYEIMITALPNALVRYEIPYYKAVVMNQRGLDSEDDLPVGFNPSESATEIRNIVSAVESKNNEKMSEWT
ncbi:eCIS core domain-containing protein [Pleionea litopenaei]|uniref:DUF4157 domain-containing protein n=1 Tax=Pleionea litopenaei TaxID=3070815 RepID=A0AA51RUN8_9GAMM|nr:DUF4157 domain-containing protein [Pleionea sp. HL-JVS1]WMS87808.1 DUF4157 domain-containing protein [Pleionea sp. HL-JVS1]